jgi:hypothetical protein
MHADCARSRRSRPTTLRCVAGWRRACRAPRTTADAPPLVKQAQGQEGTSAQAHKHKGTTHTQPARHKRSARTRRTRGARPPAGTVSWMRLASRCRPSPPQRSQGVKICPCPSQRWQPVTCWNAPSGVRTACGVRRVWCVWCVVCVCACVCVCVCACVCVCEHGRVEQAGDNCGLRCCTA